MCVSAHICAVPLFVCAGPAVLPTPNAASGGSKRPRVATTPLTDQEKQIKMRLEIEADDLGFVLVQKEMYVSELKLSILPKLVARNMSNLMQSMDTPTSALSQIMPSQKCGQLTLR